MDYTFAMTGLSEKAAKTAGIDARAVTVHKAHHVTYYPGYEDISLKIVYAKATAKSWGRRHSGKRG